MPGLREWQGKFPSPPPYSPPIVERRIFFMMAMTRTYADVQMHTMRDNVLAADPTPPRLRPRLSDADNSNFENMLTSIRDRRSAGPARCIPSGRLTAQIENGIVTRHDLQLVHGRTVMRTLLRLEQPSPSATTSQIETQEQNAQSYLHTLGLQMPVEADHYTDLIADQTADHSALYQEFGMRGLNAALTREQAQGAARYQAATGYRITADENRAAHNQLAPIAGARQGSLPSVADILRDVPGLATPGFSEPSAAPSTALSPTTMAAQALMALSEDDRMLSEAQE